MARAADAGRPHIDPARIGLGVGDELGTVFAENDGFTSITKGPRVTLATGAMSRMKLKLSFS